MNGCSIRHLCPWSAVQDDEASSVLSESVGESKMAYHRKREDGSYEKNVILKKIYKDLGTLSMSYRRPYGRMYSKNSFPGQQKRPKDRNPLRTATFPKYIPYKPKGTPRYSKIDKFIDNLNQACAALPKPLMEDFGRVRQHTVAVQPGPKKDVRMIQVRGSEPPPQSNAGEQQSDEAVFQDDSEISKSVIDAGVFPVPVVTGINIRAPPAMGPCKTAVEGSRDNERQAAKRCSDNSAFERKKIEVVRAATILQSRYRGCKVRRSQPLKYMLKIGKAKSKLEELKQQFNGWKIAVWFPTDNSERLAVTESVTNLLMELDSIQGVPVYIRDFRKSVARDAMKFQGEVDAFLRDNKQHGALFDVTGNENTRRPHSGTERRTASRHISASVNGNEPPHSCKTVQLSGNLQRGFGTVGELVGALSPNDLFSAAKGDTGESGPEDIARCDQPEPQISVTMCAEEGQCQEDSFLCPQPPVESQTDSFLCPQLCVEILAGKENNISYEGTKQPQSPGAKICDTSIPLSSSRTFRKKRYGVRFQDDVNQKEIYSGIQPCLVTQLSSGSSNEGSSSHVTASPQTDDQYYVSYNCFAESGQGELTDTVKQHDKVNPSASTAIPMTEKMVLLTINSRDGAESRKEEGQAGCVSTLFEQAPSNQHTTVTVNVPSSESLGYKSCGYMDELSCHDSKVDVNGRGQLEYQTPAGDNNNSSINRSGIIGVVTNPSKSRFYTEQSHLLTSADDRIQPSHSHVDYEGSCSSSDGATSETSEALEEPQRVCGAFHSTAILMKVPTLALGQKQKVTFNGGDIDVGAVLKSPRLGSSCGDFQSMCISVDERTSDAEADKNSERDVEIDGVPEVETVSCCSDCARPRSHYPFECWKREVRTGKEEPYLRRPCNEYHEEVQEEYIPVVYKGAGDHDDYFRPTAGAEFSGFDHRELRYIADPYTIKLRRMRQADEGRRAKDDNMFFQKEKYLLQPRGQTAVTHVPTIHAQKATLYTPSPPESICSEAEKSYRRCNSLSPHRQTVDCEKRPWETYECEFPDKELLTKLVDDNKRLKGLLKDVMNSNKAQATAMVSMSERIEHLEGVNNCPDGDYLFR